MVLPGRHYPAGPAVGGAGPSRTQPPSQPARTASSRVVLVLLVLLGRRR
ncbi:hypothetical protein Ae168Ps1_2918 [Pseudonocardia sp. Ae168_Ps1]|nr:hypothetical protein Ae150APs1_2910 [Pseudonocardia sp. Ae150A_Ps1]OLL80512.1 hypothetical protein Ae168Ps1_2918 [Pseudonocardia sp. Ae168_Ps1]OLL85360.1 hypothetical protein Ae263Ps1_2415c [Pseudonocardia sp. Ae263_Ps1]OLL94613.1 hypothetical protein Ae356Ps1_4510 [Pseudonocardia sp. Ae356_Ps1]